MSETDSLNPTTLREAIEHMRQLLEGREITLEPAPHLIHPDGHICINCRQDVTDPRASWICYITQRLAHV